MRERCTKGSPCSISLPELLIKGIPFVITPIFMFLYS